MKERLAKNKLYYCIKWFSVLVLLFLILPIIISIPLSFNASPFFSFTKEMLTLDSEGYSLRWYKEFFTDPSWNMAIKNSFIIAFFATIIATVFGTIASLGLSSSKMPYRALLMSIILSPMIIPVIIVAASTFLFYSLMNFTNGLIPLIVAHSVLGVPFVVITVTASLSNFDQALVHAANTLGASKVRAFFDITLPLITPGMFSGSLFAFITSFDEVIIVLFLGGPNEKTIPKQMFSGLREEISPTILAASTLLAILAVFLLFIFNKVQQKQAFYNR